jgi:large subunit ribosomal protein L13
MHDLEKQWFIVDGEDEIVGRIAADIAMVLMGKHKPEYTANHDTGDFVIVVNCEKVKFTGSKLNQKTYTWYTGYTGLRTETASRRLKRKPEQIIRDAVRRMLPKNKIGTAMLSKLKVYAGPEHPHKAQAPKPFELRRSSSAKA